jgi:hypothetical protein
MGRPQPEAGARLSSEATWRAIIRSSSVGTTQAAGRTGAADPARRAAGAVGGLVQLEPEPAAAPDDLLARLGVVLADAAGEDQAVDPAQGRGHRADLAHHAVDEQVDRLRA